MEPIIYCNHPQESENPDLAKSFISMFVYSLGHLVARGQVNNAV